MQPNDGISNNINDDEYTEEAKFALCFMNIDTLQQRSFHLVDCDVVADPAIFISPDCNFVACHCAKFVAGNQVQFIYLIAFHGNASAESRDVIEATGGGFAGWISAIAWSNDGRVVAYVRRANRHAPKELCLFNVVSKELQVHRMASDSTTCVLHWAKNNQWLIVVEPQPLRVSVLCAALGGMKWLRQGEVPTEMINVNDEGRGWKCSIQDDDQSESDAVYIVARPSTSAKTPTVYVLRVSGTLFD